MDIAEATVTEDSTTRPALIEAAGKVDVFESYTQPHALRIASLSEVVAGAFGFAENDLFTLKLAAILHDAGEKLMARDYISAERALAAKERFDLERHPVIGEQEAARLGHPRAVQLLIRWHHEWWNGCGYPDRLEARQIPLAARILRVCDTYASLTSDRPFRAAFSGREADEYMAEAAGIEFDPKVVSALLSVDSRATGDTRVLNDDNEEREVRLPE